MRYDLWLAQPKIENALRAALRTAGALFAVWALAAAFLLWGARGTLGRTNATLAARTQQLAQLAGGLPAKRTDAARAGRVLTSSPEGPGSAEFTAEIAALAQTAGADVTGIQISGTGAATAATGTGPAPAAGAGADGWEQDAFECSVQGPYPALSRFLDGLSASRRVLEFRALQIMPAGDGARAGDPRLQLKVTGVVSGLAEKP